MEDQPLYLPKPDEPQLTFRAVVTGSLVGGLIACTNIYIGLKIGWSFGASIISAILSFSVFAVIDRRLAIMETNIAQTSGSAAGSMASAAGLLAPIPAMTLLGYEIHWTDLLLWSLAVAFLGVFFAVPLRRQMVLVDKLKFPTGTATAQTVMALYSEASVAVAKAKVLLWAGAIAGLFKLSSYFIPHLEAPPLHDWIPIAALTTAAAWGWQLSLNPALMGAGFLIGPRVVLSLLAGAVLGWGILGPLAQYYGWAPGAPTDFKDDGVRGWLLWPGVAIMVSEALASVALSWRTFLNALTGTTKTNADSTKSEELSIPNSWWIGGLTAGSILTMVVAEYVFNIDWYFTLIAIALSSVLSVVAVRSVGETDINPVGGMGKVTQLVFGGMAPGQVPSNLMGAAITGAGASQAADMMQDLKTGHLLGASPRKQFIAQLCGICAGVLFVVPAYVLFSKAYEIGKGDLPAPAAMAWKAMAELLTNGLSALPPYSVYFASTGVLLGIVLAVLRSKPKIRGYVPSGLAIGIAFIILPSDTLVMVIGLLIWLIWRFFKPEQVKNFDYALASGMIAGYGLMGIVNAILTLCNVDPLVSLSK